MKLAFRATGRLFSHWSLAVIEQIFHGTNRNFSRRLLALCGACALALGSTFATWAVDDPKPAAPTGLRGILLAEVPSSLSEDAFAALEGNWLDWGTKTAAEVAKLYTDDSLDVTGQRQQLEVLKKKLATMSTSLKDARYRSIHETLASLHAALNRRVALAEAVLDTLAIDPAKAASARLDHRLDDTGEGMWSRH